MYVCARACMCVLKVVHVTLLYSLPNHIKISHTERQRVFSNSVLLKDTPDFNVN